MLGPELSDVAGIRSEISPIVFLSISLATIEQL
jgi:hypothetical protein